MTHHLIFFSRQGDFFAQKTAQDRLGDPEPLPKS